MGNRGGRVLLAHDIQPATSKGTYREDYGEQTNSAPTLGPYARPYLGWSSWSLGATTMKGYGRAWLHEDRVKEQALVMHERLQTAGYVYINLDSGWADGPDDYGRWKCHPKQFPSGIVSLSSYLHALGLKLGIYFIPGVFIHSYTVNSPIKGTPYRIRDIAVPADANAFTGSRYKIDFSKPGAQEYINSQVDLLAEWGVDFIKLDGIVPGSQSKSLVDARPDVMAWHHAISRSSRPMWLTISWAIPGEFLETWRANANAWRIEQDVESYDDCLTHYYNVIRNARAARKWAGLYPKGAGFQDLDSLLVGNGDMDDLTEPERRTMMTLWAIAGSPLYSGDDLTKLDDLGLSLMTNREVIDVQQRANPARLLGDDLTAIPPVEGWTPHQIWHAHNPDGTITLALINIGGEEESDNESWTFKVVLVDLLVEGAYNIRDLWNHNDIGIMSNLFSWTVDSHDSALFLLTPAP